MGKHIIVVKDSNGELDVYFSSSPDLEEEKREHVSNGEEIVSSYPLSGSLEALGVLVLDSVSLKSEDTFGNQVEKLLTTIVRDAAAKQRV